MKSGSGFRPNMCPYDSTATIVNYPYAKYRLNRSCSFAFLGNIQKDTHNSMFIYWNRLNRQLSSIQSCKKGGPLLNLFLG